MSEYIRYTNSLISRKKSEKSVGPIGSRSEPNVGISFERHRLCVSLECNGYKASSVYGFTETYRGLGLRQTGAEVGVSNETYKQRKEHVSLQIE